MCLETALDEKKTSSIYLIVLTEIQFQEKIVGQLEIELNKCIENKQNLKLKLDKCIDENAFIEFSAIGYKKLTEYKTPRESPLQSMIVSDLQARLKSIEQR